jgi:pSer/pThr/pTyr-binding forkhead associated (FHA) protein
LGAKALSIAIEVSRFAFVLIALYVLLRVVDNSLAELSARRRMKQNMQRFFGDLTVIEARNEKLVGKRYGLKWENSIGSAPRCDVCIAGGGLVKQHAVLYLHRGRAFVRPAGKSNAYVEGRPVRTRTEVFDGDAIQFGETLFALRLFTDEGEA